MVGAEGAVADLAGYPWPLLIASTSILGIYVLFRKRADLFEAIGFSTREVAIVCLGGIAGWFVDVPVYPVGGSLLTVNLGGAILPAFMTGWLLWKGKLPALKAVGGVLVVSLAAFLIADFDPAVGIVALFPWFLIPSVLALVYAIAVSLDRLVQSVPIAYVSGSIGTLLGADLYNLGPVLEHFRSVPTEERVSIGGAGVFDMVFLAGILAMAFDLLVVLLFAGGRRVPVPVAFTYPGPPIAIPEADAYLASLEGRTATTLRERALAGVALSDQALRRGDYARSVEQAHRAVDVLLRAGDPPLLERFRRRDVVNRNLLADLRALSDSRKRAAAGDASRLDAGDANTAAKHIAGALLRLLGKEGA